MDIDGSGNLSVKEFENFCLLFGFHSKVVKNLFNEFDLSGDQVRNTKLYSILINYTKIQI